MLLVLLTWLYIALVTVPVGWALQRWTVVLSTEKFVRETQRLLSKKGIAFFVINQFVPLESKAENYFSRIQLRHKEAGFKLISLQK